jgi:hypothetical protein
MKRSERPCHRHVSILIKEQVETTIFTNVSMQKDNRDSRILLQYLFYWVGYLCPQHIGFLLTLKCTYSRNSLLRQSPFLSYIFIGMRGGIHNSRDFCFHLYSGCSSEIERQIIVLAYLGGQCKMFTHMGKGADFYAILFRDGSDKWTTSNVLQISEKVQRRPWQWWDKHSWKKAWAVEAKSKVTETEKGENRWRAKSRACSTFSSTSRGLSTKNSSSQTKQSIPHTTVTFTATAWRCAKMSHRILAT